LTPTQWLICVLASIGFAFDIYELLMLPLIVRPALLELRNASPGTPEFENLVGLLFYVPALAGGFFGLIGGYLTDLFGRRRVLVWSILLYAFSACAAGFSTSFEMLLFLRCTTFIGFCVEFVAAVAWLAELFPNPRQREGVLGFTQAFSSLGGLMVTAAFWIAVTYGEHFPAIMGGHAAWRYTLISGVIPALPLILIRPFLPESPEWERKKKSGQLKRPSIAELFQPALRKTTIVTTLLVACSYGVALGAIQHVPRIVPGLPEIKALEEKMKAEAPDEATFKREFGRAREQTISGVQFSQEIGGLVGRTILAFLAVWFVGRRNLLRVFQVPALLIVPFVFLVPAQTDLTLLKIGIFVAGMLTVAQFSFWGNYLPRVYPTHLRGTGEGFAANVGGRMIGTLGALATTTLTSYMPAPTPPHKTAQAAAAVALVVLVIGNLACFFLPEPPQEELPD